MYKAKQILIGIILIVLFAGGYSFGGDDHIKIIEDLRSQILELEADLKQEQEYNIQNEEILRELIKDCK